ncbi:hypothetical protein PAXRUDRAFT_129601 [Paxillus rubicundulus Ve08.2h10]|uniref:Non-specific serine/threonine protein kinase n=1 Tax=Paxillus rubicundulus Ve08.2h10 TaxID=930991 RepID=A0A0D0DY10_9AGAM|nr:hypothetical protein PAXRUDRAFT_129601 [Paxillus rubicundulus Ve08.2h10]
MLTPFLSPCCTPFWNNVAKNLVCHLLIPDPHKRATVYTALKSFWIVADLAELEQAYRERIRSVAS